MKGSPSSENGSFSTRSLSLKSRPCQLQFNEKIKINYTPKGKGGQCVCIGCCKVQTVHFFLAFTCGQNDINNTPWTCQSNKSFKQVCTIPRRTFPFFCFRFFPASVMVEGQSGFMGSVSGTSGGGWVLTANYGETVQWKLCAKYRRPTKILQTKMNAKENRRIQELHFEEIVLYCAIIVAEKTKSLTCCISPNKGKFIKCIWKENYEKLPFWPESLYFEAGVFCESQYCYYIFVLNIKRKIFSFSRNTCNIIRKGGRKLRNQLFFFSNEILP